MSEFVGGELQDVERCVDEPDPRMKRGSRRRRRYGKRGEWHLERCAHE